MTKQLESDFSARIHDAVQQSCDLGYNPTRFRQLLTDLGAVRVAKKFMTSGDMQDGFMAVLKKGRQDLTLESIMLEPQFKPLFSTAELGAAKWRLDQANTELANQR